jgi:uncharacterized membrane protein AbrB (regulator of aidB expression)
MRWRRAASVVRGVGWVIGGFILCAAAAATFAHDALDTLTVTLFGVVSLLVIGTAHLIGWWIDKRGDRLVTR